MKQINVKINRTFLEQGMITIPNELAESILEIDTIEKKQTFQIDLIWKRIQYKVNLRHAYRSNSTDYWHLDWRDCKELKLSLKKEFIQTYIKLKSEELSLESENFYGTVEAISIKIIEKNRIKFSTYIKSKTPYDALFRKLIDNNVFYWLNDTEDSGFILKSTDWISIDELKNHPNQDFVIYYLIDSKNKKLYIGSAKKLKSRVYEKREVIPDWDYFRYEIVKPIYHNNLRNIEYHSISNFAKFLDNNANIKFLDKDFSNYKLVNRDCKGYYTNTNKNNSAVGTTKKNKKRT